MTLMKDKLFSPYILETGSVELDLLNLISPAKTPEKCSLKMLPGMAGSASTKKPLPCSLFSQKSVRGWWPCAIEQDGKHVLGVRLCPQHSPKISFIIWWLFKTVFQYFSGESGDDTGNSGREGDGWETCREGQRWAKHESQTGPTEVRNLSL